MFRRTFIQFQAPAAVVTFSLVSLGACKMEKDQNGGRPAEQITVVSTPIVPVSGPAIPAPVTPVRGTGTPVRVEYDLAERAYHEKRHDEAKELFTVYVGQRPGNPWGHYMLGLSSWKSGDLGGAESALRTAVELDGKNVKARLNLVRVLIEQDRPQDARTEVLAAASVDSTSGEVYRMMGRVHASLKENDEAIAAYRRALSVNHDDAWSMNNLALILIQQRRFEEALPELARAVQIDSGVAVFQNNLGIALEHLGQFGPATQAYRAALVLDPNYTRAARSLARVEQRGS